MCMLDGGASIWGTAIAITTAIASTAMGVYSSIQQGEATKAQYEYKAEIDKQNAKTANENAARVRQEGIEESRLQRLKAQQKAASQTSAMAANGIDVTQGTAVDILGDTAMWGEMDALQTRANYESRAYGYEVEAGNLKNQSRLDSLAGQNAYRAGQLNAISSGLNGISSTLSVADKWYGFSSSASDTKQKTDTLLSGGKSFTNKSRVKGYEPIT